ncbi:hypothetical protein OC845_001610 [Tilletia horrida]|nr:hypothetical protein OC845_001610 [Tilletia horrida]
MSGRTITPFRAGQLKPDAAIYWLPAFCAFYGIVVHVVAMYLDPHSSFTNVYLNLNERQLSARAGIPTSWPQWFQGGDDRFTLKQAALIYINFLNDAVQTQFAQAGIWILTCTLAPMLLYFSIESMKTGRAAGLGAATLIVSAALGQIGLAGFSFNVIAIPVYAWTRHSETTKAIIKNKDTNAKSPDKEGGRAIIHPQPSPSASKVNTAVFLLNIIAVIVGLALHTPQAYKTPALIANIAFWFYPVVLLPLLFPPLPGPKVSVADNPFAKLPKGTRRTAAADAYAFLAKACFALWIVSLVLIAPSLYHKVQHTRKMISSFGGYFGIPGTVYKLGFREFCKLTFPVTYAEWTILLDISGLILAAYSIVFIDMVCDDWTMSAFSGRVPGFIRHTKKRYIMEDVIVGSGPALVWGPGYSLATYFELRERSAEAARNK